MEDGVTSVSKYEYDANGNILREWKPTNAVGEAAAWAKTEYTYDSRNRLTLVKQYNGDTVAAETSYTYDACGNLLTMTAGGKTTAYTYDRFGNVLTMKDALNQTETYTYSVLGRLDSKTDRKSNTTNYAYDAAGRVLATSSGSDAIIYTYTKTGQVRTEENNWQKTTYTYDELGRAVTVLEETADDSLDYTKVYTYDLAGNRTGFTLTESAEAVQTVTYTYDTLNRLVTVSEDGVLQATYTYDTNGNRESLTYANGVQEIYTYNKANWIIGLENKQGEETISSFAYTYYASGSQQSETDHTGTVTTYTYDDLGRLTQEQTAVPEYLLPEPEPEPEPEPDPNAIIVTLDPNGGTVTPGTVDVTDAETYSLPVPSRAGYQFAGWFHNGSMVNSGDPVTITESATFTAQWEPNPYMVVFDANSPVAAPPAPLSCVYGQNVTLPSMGVVSGYRHEGWATTPNGAAVYAAGATVQNLTAEPGGTVVLYAVWHQMGLYTLRPTAGEEPELVVTETISYTYDAAGNRSQMTVSGEENYTTAYTYDANNRLLTEAKTENGEVATTAYTYDANGNTLSVSTPANAENEAVTKAYSYNRFNQQISVLTNDVPTAQYTYNAQGIRTSKTVGTEQTNFLLDGGNVAAETSGTETVSYLRGVNLISKTADTTEYYLFNAHGDVVNLTNATGATTKTYDYDAFGNERNPDEADTNPFRYCGEYYDTETGTYYLRARYYDPLLGRFTTEDPALDGLNWYTYCSANPIYFRDSTGYYRESGYYIINGVLDWYDDPDKEEFGDEYDTYMILTDLTRRWENATKQAEKDRLHALAEDVRRMSRLGTPYRYKQEEVMNLLHQNTQIGIAYMDNLLTDPNYVKGGGVPYITAYLWFIWMTCNDWDYKYNDHWRVPDDYLNREYVNYMNQLQADGSYPKNWTPWFYFDGYLWSADKLGNLNLAYVGIRMGFLKFMIRNPLTTDKDDAFAIDYGIWLAEQGR